MEAYYQMGEYADGDGDGDGDISCSYRSNLASRAELIIDLKDFCICSPVLLSLIGVE